MCGIAGVVEESARNVERTGAQVATMVHAIDHRGPDANDVQFLPSESGRSATLGSVRLRIIDLAPSADQPMSDATGRIWTVFNGEIYNHRELRAELSVAGFNFKSASDTECLVHLYRHLDGDITRIASRLRGMFAFAIWDQDAGRLVMARDRLGIKPLHWTPTAHGLAFCSEQRALATSGVISGQPNTAAIAGYLAKGVVPSGTSLLRDVEHLPAGHVAMWSGGSPDIERYWKPTPTYRADFHDLERAQDEVDRVVTDAVSRHLVADRTVGVFLSSGTDSSAIASIASRGGSQRSLTVSFPDDPTFDESAVARETARRFGLEHADVPVTETDAADALPDVLRSLDSPTADGFNSWLISRAAHESGLVVVLSGLGGDELLAGYPTFASVPRLRRAMSVIGPLPERLRASLARLAKSTRRTRPLARAFYGGAGMSAAYHVMRRIFDDDEITSLGLPAPELYQLQSRHDDVDAITMLELESYLRDQLLPDADTTSMAHSIELRVPLLDDNVVAMALALPPSVRVNGKQMLATAAQLGPRPPKRPFALPMRHWLNTSLHSTVRDALLDDGLPFGDVMPRAFRTGLWNDFERGRVHWAKPWSVAVLRLWPESNGFSW